MAHPQQIESIESHGQNAMDTAKSLYVRYWDDFGIPPAIETKKSNVFAKPINCYDTLQLEKCVFGAVARTWRYTSASSRAKDSTELFNRKQRTSRSAAVRDTNKRNTLSHTTLQRLEEAKTLPHAATLIQLSELMGLPNYYNPRSTRCTDNIQIKYRDLLVNEDELFLPDFILDTLWCFKKINQIQRTPFRGVSRYKHTNIGLSNDTLSHKDVIEFQSLYHAISTMMNTAFSVITNKLRIVTSNQQGSNIDKEISINPCSNPTLGYLSLRYLEKIIQIRQDDSIADETFFFTIALLNHCFDTLDYILFSRRKHLAAGASFYALSYLCSQDLYRNNIPEYIIPEQELTEIDSEYKKSLDIESVVHDKYWYQTRDSFHQIIKIAFNRLNIGNVLSNIGDNL